MPGEYQLVLDAGDAAFRLVPTGIKRDEILLLLGTRHASVTELATCWV